MYITQDMQLAIEVTSIRMFLYYTHSGARQQSAEHLAMVTVRLVQAGADLELQREVY